MNRFACAALVLVASCALVQAAALEPADKLEGKTDQRDAKGPNVAVPVIVLRQSTGGSSSSGGSGSGSGGQKPDFFWGFLQWDAFKPYAQTLQPISSVSQAQTQQITQQVTDNVPGALEAYNQYNQMGNQFTGYLNPSQFMNQMQGMIGSSGSNPLAQLQSMFGQGSGKGNSRSQMFQGL